MVEDFLQASCVNTTRSRRMRESSPECGIPLDWRSFHKICQLLELRIAQIVSESIDKSFARSRCLFELDDVGQHGFRYESRVDRAQGAINRLLNRRIGDPKIGSNQHIRYFEVGDCSRTIDKRPILF